jgi:alkyldihydroxyacetonephosphate synthase
MARRRKFWGWGYEGEGPDAAQAAGICRALAQRFGVEAEVRAPPRLEDLRLPPPRVTPPDALAPLCSRDPFDRASHTYGKAYRDIVRGARGAFEPAPDWVAFPRDEDDVVALLDWCGSRRLAAIPYGGGSSVVGGVEARVGDAYAGAVSIDLSGLDRVLEIDRTSRAARIQAGIYGPALADALRPSGLALRHFPQSFELSSLGGWIATRAGGHYATLHTHIDPDRLFIGSEGALGIITQAWMRLQARPVHRATAVVRFEEAEGFVRGACAVRALAQSNLYPSNCRLLDAEEARNAGAGDAALLLLGFESADHALDTWMARALECCRDAGGRVPQDAVRLRSDADAARGGAAETWRRAFLDAPYLRDVLVRAAFVTETFETAITWERFETFHAALTQAVRDALKRVCGTGSVACRFTYAYPDGPAPYYTVLAPARRGSEIEQWDEIKAAASEALLREGGTITHHHAVGRDHRPWYDRQRPEPFGAALRAAKAALDPAGVMNPGVLVDPL